MLTSLSVGATSKWVFDGLKVQSLEGRGAQQARFGRGHGQGRVLSDVQHCVREYEDLVPGQRQGWSQAQWVANARNGSGP